MRQSWVDTETCDLAGVTIKVGRKDFSSLKTTRDTVYVLKGRSFFEQYQHLFASNPPDNILEIGVFEGGSIMLFADIWEEATLVGIDLRAQNNEVIKHLQNLGFSERVKLFYSVSQDDQNKIVNIINNAFKSKIDLVIDDASHRYKFTKSTFEIVFPHISNGGHYIIEDWGWAHWRAWQTTNHLTDQVAMSNLVFELVMSSASSPEIIGKVTIDSRMCIVEKSRECPPLGDGFKLDDIYLARGKKLNLI